MPLMHLQPTFLPHYVQIASRKLLLFHGRRSLGVRGPKQRWQQQVEQAAGGGPSCSSDLVIRLSDLVNSPVMAELQELLMLGPGADLDRDLYSNWFSLQVRSRGRDAQAQAWACCPATMTACCGVWQGEHTGVG